MGDVIYGLKWLRVARMENSIVVTFKPTILQQTPDSSHTQLLSISHNAISSALSSETTWALVKERFLVCLVHDLLSTRPTQNLIAIIIRPTALPFSEQLRFLILSAPPFHRQFSHPHYHHNISLSPGLPAHTSLSRSSNRWYKHCVALQHVPLQAVFPRRQDL